MKNEGEKVKGNKVRGDSVTFRLPKKKRYDDRVIKLINSSIKKGTCNEEIIDGLDFWVKNKKWKKEIELFIHFMEKVDDPYAFSEKIVEKLYLQVMSEKLNVDIGNYTEEDFLPKKNSNEKTVEIEKDTKEEKQKIEIQEPVLQEPIIAEQYKEDEENNSFEDEVFGSMTINQNEETKREPSISRALSSIRRRI